MPKFKTDGVFPGGAGNPMSTDAPGNGAGAIDSPVNVPKGMAGCNEVKHAKRHYHKGSQITGDKSGKYPSGKGRA